MAYEDHQSPARWRWPFWSPWTRTEKVRAGDSNTDNFVVLTVSLAALAAIGISFLIYFSITPDPGVMAPR